MVTLTFDVESEFHDSDLARLLNEWKWVVADGLADVLKKAACKEYDWGSCEVYCYPHQALAEEG